MIVFRNKRTVQVTIPDACHENWQAMQPQDGGRHCQRCQQTVIDFTRMTDEQMYAYLRHSSSKTCGRFRKDQLKVYSSSAERNQAVPRWKMYALALAATVGLKSGFVYPTQAQTQMEQREPDFTPIQAMQKEAKEKQASWRGHVTDDSGQSLPGVSIVVKGTTRGTITDAGGNYILTVENQADTAAVLVFSFIGYVSAEVPVFAGKAEYNVTLQPDVKGLMGEVVVGGYAVRYPFPKNILMLPVRAFQKAKCLITQ